MGDLLLVVGRLSACSLGSQEGAVLGLVGRDEVSHGGGAGLAGAPLSVGVDLGEACSLGTFAGAVELAHALALGCVLPASSVGVVGDAPVEELVSHGYIVAAIDQPYLAATVVFPDGRQAAYDPRWDPPHSAFMDAHIPYLAQDAVFTLEQLTVLNRADPNGILTGRLDLRRAGLFGMSMGAIVADMTDVPLLASRVDLSGPVGVQRAHQIINAYSLAFFDRHLKGRPAAPLDGPAQQYPEVLLETRRP